MGIFALDGGRQCPDERALSAAAAKLRKTRGQANEAEPTNESPRSLILSFFPPRLEQKKERL